MDIENQPVTVFKGVGPKVAAKLERLGLHTVQDVMFHLPYRYQDRTRITPIGSLQPGQEALVAGEVEITDVAFRGRRNLLCHISDGTGSLLLRFFHFTQAQQDHLARGRTVRCYGEVRAGSTGPEMIHPEYEFIEPDTTAQAEASLTPVYSTTEGVHQLTVRKLARQAVEHYLPHLHEWLPADLLAELRLPTLPAALAQIHRPQLNGSSDEIEHGLAPYRRRLAFEELLAHQLSLLRLRQRQLQQRAVTVGAESPLAAQLLAALPFALTAAQQRVLTEITQDLTRAAPMHRLIQGDVGCGKTIVAALAALHVVDGGYQVAVMAPTELLAEQHVINFSQWLTPLGVAVVALGGKHSGKDRQQRLERLADKSAQVIIGTHALFQEDVVFADLGLVIIDEQHRFGVHQRLSLWEKGSKEGRRPHQLVMTATPIPRTLAQTFYADLDVSIIDALPPGRQAVETVVMPEGKRHEVVQHIHQACRDGRQAYWVCPLIEESEVMQLQAATDTEENLKAALPDLRIALVHGRMNAPEKERIMEEFKRHEVDVLVATTVIEVGVDVANASLMVLENAERLGLAQLHQLRGRVGRGAAQSSCVLLYQPRLSAAAHERLSVMRATNDGFEIARKDLEMRGPGEVLGTRQTGLEDFRIADVLRDQPLLPAVQKAARLMLEKYPGHVAPLVRRWLGEAENYGNV